jgi:hypothetical protein
VSSLRHRHRSSGGATCTTGSPARTVPRQARLRLRRQHRMRVLGRLSCQALRPSSAFIPGSAGHHPVGNRNAAPSIGSRPRGNRPGRTVLHDDLPPSRPPADRQKSCASSTAKADTPTLRHPPDDVLWPSQAPDRSCARGTSRPFDTCEGRCHDHRAHAQLERRRTEGQQPGIRCRAGSGHRDRQRRITRWLTCGDEQREKAPVVARRIARLHFTRYWIRDGSHAYADAIRAPPECPVRSTRDRSAHQDSVRTFAFRKEQPRSGARGHGLSIKLIAWDHSWDEPNDPVSTSGSRHLADGVLGR